MADDVYHRKLSSLQALKFDDFTVAILKEWSCPIWVHVTNVVIVPYTYSGFKLAISTFVLSFVEFIFIAISHKQCAFTIGFEMDCFYLEN